MSTPTLLGGRYRLLDELGTGGIARVCRAHDTVADQPVAVKQLLPQFAAEPTLRRRFLKEAEALAKLDHPHILRLKQAAEDGPTVYLVTELVDGEDLRRRLDREGALPWPEARRIAQALAEALAHAHERGVLHRDVKPANVLLGTAGQVKLADFGTARVASLAGLTGSSLVWGSPEYMAPEVFARGRVDPRSDLFSLGVLLYEMITGRLPWKSDAGLSRLTHAATAPPPEVALGQGAALDALVRSLLASTPDERPASARVILAVLRGEEAPIALVRHVACLECGALHPEDVPRCLQCGTPAPAARHVTGGGWRVVLKKLGEDAGAMQQIHRLLISLTGQPDLRLKFLLGDRRLYSRKEQREAIALPTVLFGNLDERGATELGAAFRGVGLDVVAERDRGQSLDRHRRAWRFGLGMLMTMGALGMFFGFAVNPGFFLLTLVAATVLTVRVAVTRHRARKSPPTGRFQLRSQDDPAPAAERLLAAAQHEAKQLQTLEVRRLYEAMSIELYRLARRAETWTRLGQGQGSEVALARRLLDAAPAIERRLRQATTTLDRLEATLDKDSEADLVQGLLRLERRLGHAQASERAEIEAARRDLEAALERRAATEAARSQLAALLCSLLERLRDTYRRAARLETVAERESAALAEATAELEQFLQA